jgi:hypothetical protein
MPDISANCPITKGPFWAKACLFMMYGIEVAASAPAMKRRRVVPLPPVIMSILPAWLWLIFRRSCVASPDLVGVVRLAENERCSRATIKYETSSSQYLS